jgi:hypothetical protein
MKIRIGDSTRGYTHAEVRQAKTGRYTLVSGSVDGVKNIAVAAVRGLNEDDKHPAAWIGEDSLPVYIISR